MIQSNKPIVFSCSGCSDLAETAHDLALNLELDGIAEASCVAGVTGKICPFVEQVESGRPIITIDGCNLCCAKSSLDAFGVTTEHAFAISSEALKKPAKKKYPIRQAFVAMKHIYEELAKAGYSIGQ